MEESKQEEIEQFKRDYEDLLRDIKSQSEKDMNTLRSNATSHEDQSEKFEIMNQQIEQLNRELGLKDKELTLMRKELQGGKRKRQALEEKFNKLKQAPRQHVDLGKDTQLVLKSKCKQLEGDKKKLKVQMQEMQHKLEQEKLENLNFKKRVNREREKMV